jgi:hypothetical protein
MMKSPANLAQTARGEVHILLIEPTGTPDTGDKTTTAPRILA